MDLFVLRFSELFLEWTSLITANSVLSGVLIEKRFGLEDFEATCAVEERSAMNPIQMLPRNNQHRVN